ncbi:MAG TPA: thioesterase family protein [Bacteroidales bacterium]|nr:thioesterase family protein [Bacteroidales bacterium]
MTGETKYRVCYGDTDQMGVVYYGHYPRLYEIGRTELIRSVGFPYKKVEDEGIFMPVRSVKIDYLKSAYYDDLLTIRTIIKDLPVVKFKIFTEIYNEKGELLNKGETVLGIMDSKTGRPTPAPRNFLDAISSLDS